MIVKNLLITLSLFLFTLIASSQHKLTGHIHDKYNEEIPFSKISLTNFGSPSLRRTSSDFDGKYKLDSLTAGSYVLKIEALGYKTKEVKFDLSRDTIIDITMEDGPNIMDEITIVEYIVPLIDKDNQHYHFEKMVPKDCDLDTIQREGLLEPNEMRAYLLEYLKYPKYSIAEQNQGSVYCLVSINSEGYITAVQIERGISECLDNMVISAFLCMPRLAMKTKLPNERYYNNGVSGYEEGEYLFPIRFRLE